MIFKTGALLDTLKSLCYLKTRSSAYITARWLKLNARTDQLLRSDWKLTPEMEGLRVGNCVRRMKKAILIVFIASFCNHPQFTSASILRSSGCFLDENACKQDEVCVDDKRYGKCVPTHDVLSHAFGSNKKLIRKEYTRRESEQDETIRRLINEFGDVYDLQDPYNMCILEGIIYGIQTGENIRGEYCRALLYPKKNENNENNEVGQQFGNSNSQQYRYMMSRVNKHRGGEVTSPEIEGVVKYEPDNNDDDDVQDTRFTRHADSGVDLPHERYPFERKNPMKKSRLPYQGTPLYQPQQLTLDQMKEIGGQKMAYDAAWNQLSIEDLVDLSRILGATMKQTNNEIPDYEQKNKYSSNMENSEKVDYRDQPRVDPDERSGDLGITRVGDLGFTREMDMFQPNYENNDDVNKNPKIGVFSEGGAMFVPNDDNNRMHDGRMSPLEKTLRAFHRNERVDVKKPGPGYNINNFAFTNEGNEYKQTENDNDYVAEDELQSDNSNQDELQGSLSTPPKYVTAKNVAPLARFQISSGHQYVPAFSRMHFSNDQRLYNSTYVHIITRRPVTLKDGVKLVNIITKMLEYNPHTLSNIRVKDRAITFKVNPNKYYDTAEAVKNHLDVRKSIIEDASHIEIEKIGTGFLDFASKEKNANDGNPDNNYVYVSIKEPMKYWEDGIENVNGIMKLLNFPEESYSHIRVRENDLTFKVLNNEQGADSSDVAKMIQQHSPIIQRKLNLNILATGVADRDKISNVGLPLKEPVVKSHKQLAVVILGACVGALVIVAAIFVYHRLQNDKNDKTLFGKKAETETGKLYQDLCRGRMTSKQSTQRSLSQKSLSQRSSPQRMMSASKECADSSPTGRTASTSSWGEELATSMDITTGHMVLAYMEAHLKNKAKLDEEWAALCSYQADPCSTSIALLPENAKKNRYENAVPYDHARITLDALANVNGSDYINASTITDHDPRNAAYIAAQGPMENTIVDFWQMIWEQGCVVIVMLTSLVENGVNMCVAYWPINGKAHTYNIYEVHLVSEHVWNDNFLVRNFYLKNLKTTETRTVTQFHFLKWLEGDVPASTKALLEFRRKVNKSFRGLSCPILVHCSDGVGRTGSYLLLDMVLNRIAKGAKEIDMAATLEHIRDQRRGAILNKTQFQFILSAVADEVQTILNALPHHENKSMDSANEDEGKSK